MRPNHVLLKLNPLSRILMLSFLIGVNGCQEFTPYTMASGSSDAKATLSPSSVLTPEPQNTKFLEVLGIRADNQLSQCRNPEACDQAHFLKGLTALHSNQDTASYHFQKVMESSPQSHFGQASRVWLWLLDEIRVSRSRPASDLNMTRELVQALLNRDLQFLEETSAIRPPTSPNLETHLVAQEAKVKALSEQIHELSQEVATLKTKSASLHSLQKELRVRDKKVAELTSQLDALRRIDQELKEKAAPTTPSETILPPKEEARDSP